jgi:uncharacterized protein
MSDRTPEETRAFAESAIDAFYDAISEAQSRELRELPKRISTMNARASVKLRQVSVVADEVFRLAEGRAACARGCAHCCHGAVPITAAEARFIGEQIGVQPSDVANSPRRSKQSFSTETPCLFLKNGECSIYESRPLLCRTHFNFDRDNYWCRCENWDTPAASIPKPVIPQLQDACRKAVGQRPADSVVADIRDFFPDGLS